MFKTNKKILLTGGSGRLGFNIRKLIKCDASDESIFINPSNLTPAEIELDIRDYKKCLRVIKKYKPDIIIHCAAWTDVLGAEKNKKECWDTNVIGTQNMVRAARGRRFIYISTEYVFDGERGNYKETDTPNPVNFYSLTKLVGEFIVSQYKNTLIIRTSFKQDGPWQYPKAFVDQWTGADFARERAPDIIKAALMTDLTGLIHITGKRKSIYDLARRASPDVGKMSIKDVKVKLPKDTSLDISLWKRILKSSRVKE